jgi:hypothetical protein
VIRRIDPAVWLALLVAVLYLGPEHLAGATDMRQGAIEYVAAGIEAAALWAACAWLFWGRYASAVCMWAASEAYMRTSCRLQLPMNAPVQIPDDQTLCTAIYGPAAFWVSMLMACCAAFLAAKSIQVRQHDAAHKIA